MFFNFPYFNDYAIFKREEYINSFQHFHRFNNIFNNNNLKKYLTLCKLIWIILILNDVEYKMPILARIKSIVYSYKKFNHKIVYLTDLKIF